MRHPLQDPENPISLQSRFSQYNPILPLSLAWPGPQFCGEGEQQLLVVGTIPSHSRVPLELVFAGHGQDEAFHVQVGLVKPTLSSWSSTLISD